MQTVLDALLALPAPLVMVLAALVLAGEPAFIPGILLPSVSTALALGFLADNGVLTTPAALLTAGVAVVVGDTSAYLAGRRSASGEPPAAPRWRITFVRRRLDGATHRAARLLGRYGGGAVFVARWVVGARTVVPRLAGAGGMPLGAFLRYSVPAGVLWSTCWVGAGQLAGSSYRQVSTVAGQASVGLLVAATTVVVGIVAGRRLGRRAGGLPAGVSAARLVVALTALGSGLTALVVLAVRAGGVPRLDEPVAALLTPDPRNGLVVAAEALLLSTPSYAVVAAAAAIVLMRPVRSPRLHSALGVLASGGAVVPLIILTVLLNAAEAITRTENLFAIQHATSTTAVALATWTVARKQRTRLVRGSAWTLGTAVAALLAVDRVYLGWGSVSSTRAALLIGVAWAGVFTAAWAAAPTRVAGPTISGGDTTGTAEQPATKYGHGASPVHQAVVKIGERLDFGPVVAGRAWLATGSTVQLEHDEYLLGPPRPTPSGGDRLALRAGLNSGPWGIPRGSRSETRQGKLTLRNFSALSRRPGQEGQLARGRSRSAY